LVLEEGYRYEGIPGAADYFLMHFKEYSRWLQFKPRDIPLLRRTSSTNYLLHSPELGDKAEFQWRISTALSAIALALLAVPLSQVAPRQGRYARFFPAVIIFIIYVNLLSISKRWVEAGVLPAYVGVWWVHAVIVGFAIWRIRRQVWR